MSMTTQQIKEITAIGFDVNLSDVLSKTRKQKFVKPRVAMAFFLKNYAPKTLHEIAIELGYTGKKGNPDHSTVLWAIERYSDLQFTDNFFRDTTKKIAMAIDLQLTAEQLEGMKQYEQQKQNLISEVEKAWAEKQASKKKGKKDKQPKEK